VEQTLAGAASHYRDREVVDVDLIAKYVFDTPACIASKCSAAEPRSGVRKR
jgi:hypothetical protein